VIKAKLFRYIFPVLATLTLMLGIALPVQAAPTDIITVTNTPMSLTNDVTPDTWTVNGLTGNSRVLVSTTYYSNAAGGTTTDNVTPTVGGATDAQCYFTANATGTNVVSDLTVTSSDMAGGSDASTNGNSGAAGATSYGAKSYFSGQASGSWVIAKSSGSSVGYASLGINDSIKFGMVIAEQADAWTGNTSSTFTVTVTISAH
jgi:hypothetical protein